LLPERKLGGGQRHIAVHQIVIGGELREIGQRHRLMHHINAKPFAGEANRLQPDVQRIVAVHRHHHQS